MVAAARLLGEVMPKSDARRIGRAFDFMEIAEEEIAAAKKRSPRRQKEIDAYFGVLYPGELLGYGEGAYRSHCRELLRRAARREDLSPGTDAECLVAFSEASLRAPLKGPWAKAMSDMFRRVYPEAPSELETGAESYPGEVAEIVDGLRKKLTRDRGA